MSENRKPSPLDGHDDDCEITTLLRAPRKPIGELRFAHDSRNVRGARCTCEKKQAQNTFERNFEAGLF